MPFQIISSIFEKLFPKLKQKLTRTLTTPATMSLVSNRDGGLEGGKQVPYISFDAVVGRNSAFYLLTSDQLDEIGGVEYRALNSLLWIVPFVSILTFSRYYLADNLLFIAVSYWDPTVLLHNHCTIYLYEKVEQHLCAPRAAETDSFHMVSYRRCQHGCFFIFFHRFAAFQVVSAYTNTGTSLVDQSMVPFQRAYPMVILMSFLILAGNTSFVSNHNGPHVPPLSISRSRYCKSLFLGCFTTPSRSLGDSLRFLMYALSLTLITYIHACVDGC